VAAPAASPPGAGCCLRWQLNHLPSAAAEASVSGEISHELNEERFDLYRGGRSVGYATTIDCGHEVWIAEVYVQPDHRGLGLATTLLEAIFSRHAGRVLALAAEPFEWPDRHPVQPAQMVSADELVAWYARRGFHRDGGHRMVRWPAPEAVPARPGLGAVGGRDQVAGRRVPGNQMTCYPRGPEREMEI
jgi:GNAT superfamily N-acetyltransferase